MLKGKKVAEMQFANGNSVEFLNMGAQEETVESLHEKLRAEIELLKTELRALEERVEELEGRD